MYSTSTAYRCDTLNSHLAYTKSDRRYPPFMLVISNDHSSAHFRPIQSLFQLWPKLLQLAFEKVDIRKHETRACHWRSYLSRRQIVQSRKSELLSFFCGRTFTTSFGAKNFIPRERCLILASTCYSVRQSLWASLYIISRFPFFNSERPLLAFYCCCLDNTCLEEH